MAAALALALSFAVLLTGCGGDSADAPGAVTPAEAEALDDAAQMLDERRLPPEALPTQMPSSAPSAAAVEMTGDPASQPG